MTCKRYFLTFIDKTGGELEIYLLRTKDEVEKFYKEYEAKMWIQHQKRIKPLDMMEERNTHQINLKDTKQVKNN